MTMTITPTVSGPINRLVRAVQLLSVNATLAWAESDVHYFTHVDPYPLMVATLERDIQVLRVRQALLRS